MFNTDTYNNYRRKLSTLDFKHNSQHVAAAAAASTAQQQGTMTVTGVQGQQIVSSAVQQQVVGAVATTAAQVATLLPTQPQQLKPASAGSQVSPTLTGNIPITQ